MGGRETRVARSSESDDARMGKQVCQTIPEREMKLKKSWSNSAKKDMLHRIGKEVNYGKSASYGLWQL